LKWKLWIRRVVKVNKLKQLFQVGGFVGYIFVDRVNVSLKLVEQGLSKVHYSGKQGKYANELIAAEERAQAAKLGLWKDWTPPVEEVAPGSFSKKYFFYIKCSCFV